MKFEKKIVIYNLTYKKAAYHYYLKTLENKKEK